MKRVLAALLVLAACFLLCACGSGGMLRQVQEKFDAQQWRETVTEAKLLIARYPGSDEARQAHMLLLLSRAALRGHMAARLYNEAIYALTLRDWKTAMNKAVILYKDYADTFDPRAAQSVMWRAGAGIRRDRAEWIFGSCTGTADGVNIYIIVQKTG